MMYVSSKICWDLIILISMGFRKQLESSSKFVDAMSPKTLSNAATNLFRWMFLWILGWQIYVWVFKYLNGDLSYKEYNHSENVLWNFLKQISGNSFESPSDGPGFMSWGKVRSLDFSDKSHFRGAYDFRVTASPLQ